MKKLMVIGPVASGKSTLINYLEQSPEEVLKTVVPEYYDSMIDTPGEYTEHSRYYGYLQVISADCDCIVLLVACDSQNIYFPPNITQIFLGKPCVGLVSKIDIATNDDILRCKQILSDAGVEQIFEISVKDRKGLEVFKDFIQDRSKGRAV
ncbi:MAG: EutP/PduV family microcompartment system protein [Treponemataceae bacterium]